MTWAEFGRTVKAVPMADVLRELGIGSKGRRWHCPFHSDRNPSASVYEPKNILHCFTCNASWGVVDVVMHCEGLNFRDASEQLAERFGIPLPEKATQKEIKEYRANAEDKQNAEWWGEAATEIAQMDLDRLEPWDHRRSGPTRIIEVVRGGGASLTAEYRAWLASDRKLTRAMVHAGRRATLGREALLKKYIATWGEENAAAA